MKKALKIFGIIFIGIVMLLVTMMCSVQAATVADNSSSRSENIKYTFQDYANRILKDGEENDAEQWLQQYYDLLEHSRTCSVCGSSGSAWSKTVSHMGHTNCGMSNRVEKVLEGCSMKNEWIAILTTFADKYYHSDKYNINFDGLTWSTIVTDLETWIKTFLTDDLQGGITISTLVDMLNNPTTGFYPLDILRKFTAVFCLKNGTYLMTSSAGYLNTDHNGSYNIKDSFYVIWTDSTLRYEGDYTALITDYFDDDDDRDYSGYVYGVSGLTSSVSDFIVGSLSSDAESETEEATTDDSSSSLELATEVDRSDYLVGAIWYYGGSSGTYKYVQGDWRGKNRYVNSNQTFKSTPVDLKSVSTSYSGTEVYDLRYAVTYSEKYISQYSSPGSSGYVGYGYERTQVTVWMYTNGPGIFGVANTDSGTGEDGDEGVDQFDYTDFDDFDLYHANQAFVDYDTNEKSQHGTSPSISIYSDISKDSDTGTTLQNYSSSGIATYTVGPFYMSDYAYANSEYAAYFSGASVDDYEELLGGIISGYVIVADDNGNTKTLEVTSSSSWSGSNGTVEVIYSGNGATKGTQSNRSGDDWSAPSDYIFPWPESTFYLELQLPLDYTQITEIGFEYRTTSSQGNGWVIESYYLQTKFTTATTADSTSCTYSAPCYESLSYLPSGWDDYYGESYDNEFTGSKNGLGTGTTHTCTHTWTVHKTITVTVTDDEGNESEEEKDVYDTYSATHEIDEDEFTCSHGHLFCVTNHWSLSSAYLVKGQPLLAVNDATVTVKSSVFKLTIPIRLTTDISVNKYISNVEHSLSYDGYDSTMGQTDDRSQLSETQKEANPVYVEYGDIVTYTIALQNNQAQAVSMRIRDNWPSNCELLSVTYSESGFRYYNSNSNHWFYTDWIVVPGSSTAYITVRVKVNSVESGVIWENSATIITRNGQTKEPISNTAINVDYMYTYDTSHTLYGRVVNIAELIGEKLESEDDFTLNDYNATIDKYVSQYNEEMTTDNNNNSFTTETNTLADRYSMTEDEKKNAPLAVEKTETLIYSIRITNDSTVTTNSSVPTATKKATTVRPTKIQEQLQTGLEYLSVYARIYKADGTDKYGKDIPLNVAEVGTDSNIYTFTLQSNTLDGKMIMLDPGEYIIYYVEVEVTESNMYLYSLSNTGTISILTNVNDVRSTDKREVQNESGTNENTSTQQESVEYVKMKELVISGKVWLDTDKDGYIGQNQDGQLGGVIDVTAQPSTDIDESQEYALQGIIVRLYRVDSSGNSILVRTTTTDSDGLYTFGRDADLTYYNGSYLADGSGVTESEQRIDKADGKDNYLNYTTSSTLYNYYIEYEYDGLVYKSTEVYSNTDHLDSNGDLTSETNSSGTQLYEIDSNATEFKNQRDNFDDQYEIIGYEVGYYGNTAVDSSTGKLSTSSADTTTISYDKNGHNSYINENDARDMYAYSFVIDTSTKDVNNINQLFIYKQTSSYTYPETEYLKYINLGLEEREDVDISITQDVYEVTTTVNGEQMTYEYNQNEYTRDNRTDGTSIDTTKDDTTTAYDTEYYMTGYVGDDSVLTPYSFKIYNSDYNYRVSQYSIATVRNYKGVESELNVEVGYRIRITNEAITDDEPYLASGSQDIKVYTGINEIVEYYDTDFWDLEFNTDGTVKTINVKTEDSEGYLVNTALQVVDAYYVKSDGTTIPAVLSNSSLYNDERTLTDENGTQIYSTLYIRPSDSAPYYGSIILEEGESVDIIITFQVDDTKSSSELDSNGDADGEFEFTLGDKINIAEISAYSTYYKNADGTYYAAGLVDKDSSAGDFGKEYNEYAGVTNVDSQDYLALYEDDTFKTGISIDLQGSDQERSITGFVWDDARTDEITDDEGTQYAGDGVYDTTKTALDDAKTNASVDETNDIPIEDVQVQLLESIEVPVTDASGSYVRDTDGNIEIQIYEQTIYANGEDDGSGSIYSTMVTRTDSDGTYELDGYVPGNYIVRFYYGDDESLNNMLIYNGQDYKSTSYETQTTTYAETYGLDETKSITDADGKVLTGTDATLYTLEIEDLSDAKDDELRRLEVISYSETMTNTLNVILRGENTTDATALTENTSMTSDTTEFLVRAEKEYADVTVLTYAETMDKINSTDRHPIENIDLGLEYRPEAQVDLDKFMSELIITTSDTSGSQTPLVDAVFTEYYGLVVETDSISGTTEFLKDADGNVIQVDADATAAEVQAQFTSAYENTDLLDNCIMNDDGNYVIVLAGTELNETASIGLSNMQYVSNEVGIETDANGDYETDADGNYVIETEQGFIYLNIDDDIMQGATVTIKYLFSGNNLSEVDRVSEELSAIRYEDNNATDAYKGDETYKTTDSTQTDETKYKYYYYDIAVQNGSTTNGYTTKDYSAALTARNYLFSEYYGYELNADNTIKTDDNGDPIVYKVKYKDLIVDDTNKVNYADYEGYYGRYLGSTYYLGKIGDKDIVADLKIDKILDYVDNDLTFSTTDNSTENNFWQTTTSRELLTSGLVSGSSYIDVTTSSDGNWVSGLTTANGLGVSITDSSLIGSLYLVDNKGRQYDTEEVSNLALSVDDRTSDDDDSDTLNKEVTYLTPRYSKATTSYSIVSLVTTKVIASEDDTEDTTYENIAEIVQYSSVTGRVTNLATTLGNVSLIEVTETPDDPDDPDSPTTTTTTVHTEWDESTFESDTAGVEKVTLTPPTGLSKTEQIIQTTVKGASYTIVVIAIVAVIVALSLLGVRVYRKKHKIK